MRVIHLVHWKKSGIYVAVDALKNYGPAHGDEHFIEVLREGKEFSDKLKSVYVFLSFILKANFGRYDSINLHSFAPHLASVFIFSKKISIFFHSNYPFLHSQSKKDQLKKKVESLIASKVQAITISRIVKLNVDSALGINSKIAYNIVQTRSGSVAAPKKIRIFGSAGRFDPEKRFIELVNAFVSLTQSTQLHLAGDGTQLSIIESIVSSKGTKKINLVGRLNDMGQFFDSLDAYICSSAYEGFGLAIAEAMAAGKLIISTRVGILAEDYNFQFIELNPDLSNLQQSIESAIALNDATIALMVNRNLSVLKQYFVAENAYQMYRDSQSWSIH